MSKNKITDPKWTNIQDRLIITNNDMINDIKKVINILNGKVPQRIDYKKFGKISF